MQIAIALYPGFTVLDAIGPYQVFAELPDADTVVCAARRGRLDDEDRQLHLDIEHTFDEVTEPGVLLVPGGCTPDRIPDDYGAVIEWARAAHEHTTFTTSVCTGALLLGAAGLLEGLRATTHWLSTERLRGYGAEPADERVVFQGRVVTGAGVSAGIDLALAVVAALRGNETAQAVQLVIEYDPRPPFTGNPSAAAPEVRALAGDLNSRSSAARRTRWPHGRRDEPAAG